MGGSQLGRGDRHCGKYSTFDDFSKIAQRVFGPRQPKSLQICHSCHCWRLSNDTSALNKSKYFIFYKSGKYRYSGNPWALAHFSSGGFLALKKQELMRVHTGSI